MCWCSKKIQCKHTNAATMLQLLAVVQVQSTDVCSVADPMALARHVPCFTLQYNTLHAPLNQQLEPNQEPCFTYQTAKSPSLTTNTANASQYKVRVPLCRSLQWGPFVAAATPPPPRATRSNVRTTAQERCTDGTPHQDCSHSLQQQHIYSWSADDVHDCDPR
jgi:hypothetical protein